MSYCRFSSNNWMCDVYVYEGMGGRFVTHVAGNQLAFPPIPDILFSSWSTRLVAWFGGKWDRDKRGMVYPSRRKEVLAKGWFAVLSFWYRWIHMGTLRLIPRRSIGLPHSGKTFDDDSAEDCAYRLEELRDLGYRVPQAAISSLRSSEAPE